MYGLITGIILFISVLLILVVLVQNPKGGGLASGFSSSNQIMGVRKTTDFLEKATWGLAVFMVLMSVVSAYVVPTTTQASDAVLEEAQKEQGTNPYNIPAGSSAPKGNVPTATTTTAPASNSGSAPATPASTPTK